MRGLELDLFGDPQGGLYAEPLVRQRLGLGPQPDPAWRQPGTKVLHIPDFDYRTTCVCFDKTLAYAKERQAFGRSIGRFQVIRHKFAEMATKIESARQMVYTTAWRFMNGEYPVREISIAKLHASRIAVEVADECIQIHGGAGWVVERGQASGRPSGLREIR